MLKSRLIALVLLAIAPLASAQSTWPEIAKLAAERHGEPGAQAAAFLAEHRPERDDAIDPAIVLESIAVALRARDTYPWAKDLSEDLFLNDVLPYATLDEPRVLTRERVHDLAAGIVEGATTAEEAAQALNRELFKLTGVRYSTQRLRANQNSAETLDTQLASCTGLSILLVDACRGVGIPARVAGIASWTDRNGNHTWVEIHDGERWRFTGAAEYDANGLDRGWFTGPASSAIEGHELHAIWASSWRTTGHRFPLAWNMADRSVPGVDVSSRYARAASGDAEPVLAIRLWSSRGGPRLASIATLHGTDQTAETFADPIDINRVAEFPSTETRPLRIAFTAVGETRTATLDESHQPGRVIELYWDELALSESNAAKIAEQSWIAHADSIREDRAKQLEALVINAGGPDMKLLKREFGEAPESGHSLWISMHGGGGAPPEVNDQQWRNQIRLYTLDEGIYIAPRAPSNEWNLWHRSEIDALFDHLIESAVVAWGVDPNRVYLLGYSAGGDGVYQLAPRTADRYAAASMMAGHPNDASPLGLRNLPFAIFMGGQDSAYNRNKVAEQWGSRLATLRADDPAGYPHRVTIYPEDGHWMGGKDAEALPWMASHTRNPWPTTIVWHQGNTTHDRFYWLAVDADSAAKGQTIRATVDGQTVTIDSEDVQQVELLLSDQLLDLDQPVTIIANGTTVHEGEIPRTEQAIQRSLELRPDPTMIATATITIELPNN
jgi:transglutaminase-like putative cysteine protease/predicted esterase